MFSCEFYEISKNIFLQNTAGVLYGHNILPFLKLSAYYISEAFPLSCSSKKVFCKYAANLQDNTHTEV